MRGRISAPRWMVLLALGVAVALHLACLVPSHVSRSTRSPTPTSTSPSLSSPAPAPTPTTSMIIARISEADLNESLREMEPSLGEGIDCREVGLKVRRTGLTLSMTIEIAQLPRVLIPVEILARPVVRDKRLQLEVLDVQLGGPYALISGLVKPMLAAGIAEAFDADRLPTQPGWHVSDVQLEDGYIVVTTLPDS